MDEQTAQKVAATGQGLFVAGCGMSVLFWIIIPLFGLTFLFILSAAGLLD